MLHAPFQLRPPSLNAPKTVLSLKKAGKRLYQWQLHSNEKGVTGLPPIDNRLASYGLRPIGG
jgi:hypothetical protein